MTHLQVELQQLKESLSEMGRLVNSQIKKSTCALLEADEDLASEVLANERRVNAMELKIDRDCEHIFTLLTPVANDMRLVFSTLKINADLERIGDYAEGMANLILLGKKSFDKQLIEELRIKQMTDIAMGMLEDVITAYDNVDPKMARTVFAKDLEINEVNQKASAIVEVYIKNHLDKIQQALLLLSIIRKMERVGDHITNIAEEVIFIKEAKVLKHINKTSPDKKL